MNGSGGLTPTPHRSARANLVTMAGQTTQTHHQIERRQSKTVDEIDYAWTVQVAPGGPTPTSHRSARANLVTLAGRITQKHHQTERRQPETVDELEYAWTVQVVRH